MSRVAEARTAAAFSAALAWRARLPISILVAAAMLWVGLAAPNISDPAIPGMADRITRGQTYDPALLRQIVTANAAPAREACNSRVQRQLLILQLSAADRSVRGPDPQIADADISAVDSLSRALVACAPTQSSGWLGAYWSEIRRNGFGPRASSLLDQSYRFAPHEAWLQLIRAPMALRAFEALSPALQSDALNDFEDIFRAQLFPSAAVLYRSAPSAVRPRLLDRTCGATQHERQVFLHFVTEAGLPLRHRCYPANDKPPFMK